MLGPPLLVEGDGAIDEAGRAEAALQSVVGHEGALHRVQIIGAMVLNRLHVAADDILDRQQATGHRPAVHQDRARAAGTSAASELGPGQPQLPAQQLDQRLVAMLDVQLVIAAVNRRLNHWLFSRILDRNYRMF